MKICDLIDLLHARALTTIQNPKHEIYYACGADLMSDVLRFSPGKGILITGLTNIHALRTAEMAGISCVLFVRGKLPPDDVVEEAEQESIVLLQTDRPMFETCGLLYSGGVKSGEDE